jgi:predicted NACHT family NTPase
VGDGGSGKSTALKRIAYELARRPIDDPTSIRIPILLRARDLAENASTSLLDQAIERIRQLVPNLKQPFNVDDLTRGRVIFMIDGLDEIGSAATTDTVLHLIHDLHIQYPQCQILVTSRSTQYITSSERMRAFTPFNLTYLNLSQADKILRALAKRQSLSPEDSAEILRQLQQMHGISLSPLIVTIFVATSDMRRSAEHHGAFQKVHGIDAWSLGRGKAPSSTDTGTG